MFKLALELSDAEIEACRPKLEDGDISQISSKSSSVSKDTISRIARKVSERSGLRRSTFEQINEAQDSVDSLERALDAITATPSAGIVEFDAIVADAKKHALLADTDAALQLLGKADALLGKAGSKYEKRRAFVKEAQANLALSEGKFADAAKFFELSASLVALDSDDEAAEKRHEFAFTMYSHSRTKGSDAARHALLLYDANRPFCAQHEEKMHWATGEIDRASCLSEIACLSKASDGRELLVEAVSNLRTVIADADFNELSFEIRGYAANSLGLALLDLSDRQDADDASKSTQYSYKVFAESRDLFRARKYETDFLVHMTRSCQKCAVSEPLFAAEKLEEAEGLLEEAIRVGHASEDKLSSGYAEAQRLRLMCDQILFYGPDIAEETRDQFLRNAKKASDCCSGVFDARNSPIDFGRYKTSEAQFYFACAASTDVLRNDTLLRRAASSAAEALSAFEISYAPIDWARAKLTLGQVSFAQSLHSTSRRERLLKSLIYCGDAKEVFYQAGLVGESDTARLIEDKVQSEL